MEAFNSVASNKYLNVRTHEYQGLLQIVVASQEIQPRISDIFSCSIATGIIYQGTATCLRFAIDDSTLCFMNANVSETEAASTIQDLAAQAFKQDRDMQYQKYEFKNHSIQVI
jgi:hypothetical protein